MAAETLTGLKLRVRRLLLGKSDATDVWEDDDIRVAVVVNIRTLQSDVLAAFIDDLKALETVFSSLLVNADYTGINVNYHSFTSGTVLKILTLKSDNQPWDEVNDEYLESVKGYEGNVAYSASEARLFTWGGNRTAVTEVIYTYPTIPTDQAYSIQYIKKAEESGNMDLPVIPNFQEIVVFGATAQVAANKTRDMKLAGWCLEQRELKLKHIRESYGNAG